MVRQTALFQFLNSPLTGSWILSRFIIIIIIILHLRCPHSRVSDSYFNLLKYQDSMSYFFKATDR